MVEVKMVVRCPKCGEKIDLIETGVQYEFVIRSEEAKTGVSDAEKGHGGSEGVSTEENR